MQAHNKKKQKKNGILSTFIDKSCFLNMALNQTASQS